MCPLQLDKVLKARVYAETVEITGRYTWSNFANPQRGKHFIGNL